MPGGFLQRQTRSEHDESLADVTLDVLLLDTDGVEADSLGDRAALADSDDITDSDTLEARRQVSGHVVVALLEPVVLLDVMQVVTAEDDGSGHLVRENDAPVKS